MKNTVFARILTILIHFGLVVTFLILAIKNFILAGEMENAGEVGELTKEVLQKTAWLYLAGIVIAVFSMIMCFYFITIYEEVENIDCVNNSIYKKVSTIESKISMIEKEIKTNRENTIEQKVELKEERYYELVKLLNQGVITKDEFGKLTKDIK